MQTDKQKLETVWTKSVCKEIAAIGGRVYVIGAGRFSSAGLPDRYVSSVIWHGWIEFKGRDTPIRTDQKLTMRDMNIRQPGSAYVVRFPNVIEYGTCGFDTTFDGTGLGLLTGLQQLTLRLNLQRS